MLTVKWQYTVNGNQVEHVYEAEMVTAGFRDTLPQSTNVIPPWTLCGRNVEQNIVVLDGWDLGSHSFDCGKIYVMNENGKTVATYVLRDVDLAAMPLATAPAPMGEAA